MWAWCTRARLLLNRSYGWLWYFTCRSVGYYGRHVAGLWYTLCPQWWVQNKSCPSTYTIIILQNKYMYIFCIGYWCINSIQKQHWDNSNLSYKYEIKPLNLANWNIIYIYLMGRDWLGDVKSFLHIWGTNMNIEIFQIKHGICITGNLLIGSHYVLQNKF